MKISLLQTDVVYKDKSQNLQQVSTMLAEADVVGDIVVLPELFSTGYIFDTAKEIHALSEEFVKSPSINALAKLADKHNTMIVAGIAEKDENRFYNSVAVVDKSGLKYKYRKISQTNIDKKYFSRGEELLTFEYAGIVFGVAVCFDVWFPEIIREYSKANVDVLLHPANFGGEQSLVISRARAIENHMYVITCNRLGEDSTRELIGKYCGKSQICTPNGDYIVKLGLEPAIRTVTLPQIEHKQVIGVGLEEEVNSIQKQLNQKQQ